MTSYARASTRIVLLHNAFTYRNLFEVERKRFPDYGIDALKYDYVTLDDINVHFEPGRRLKFGGKQAYDFTVPAGTLISSGWPHKVVTPNFYDYMMYDRYSANEWIIHEYVSMANEPDVRNMPALDRACIFQRTTWRRYMTGAIAPAQWAVDKVRGDVPVLRLAKDYGIEKFNTLGAVMVDIEARLE